MERSVYDRMNEFEARHWWFAARRELIGSLIERRSEGRPLRILEAGCGSGGNLALLGRYGTVDAFECDDAALVQARGKSGIDVRRGSLPTAAPFEGQHYDLIGLFDVLEHVEADREALTALAERLEEGGCILVTVPAFRWLWSRHDERHHHFRRYNRASLAAAAHAAGLRLSYASYFNTLLFPLAVAARAIKSLTKSDRPDDGLPPEVLNRILHRVFAFERHLLGRVKLPLGLSLVAVLEKA